MSDKELEEEVRKIQAPAMEPQPWGVGTRLHQHGDETVFETIQDVEPVLEYAAALRDAYVPHAKDRPFRMAFTIPIVAYKQALTELGIPHERMYRLTQEERQRLGVVLNGPDYKLLRTVPGRH